MRGLPRKARAMYDTIAPRYGEITDDLLFGEIWDRPDLTHRERSLCVIAALTALYRTDQIRAHVQLGLNNGCSEEEIAEVMLMMAFYASWPCAGNALRVASEVFEERAGSDA